MLRYYQQVESGKLNADILNKLVLQYGKQTGQKEIETNNQIPGPLPGTTSPNGKCRVRIQKDDTGIHALTCVVIILGGGSGTLYCAKGENLPIQVYWKDDSTIVINTGKNDDIYY